MTNDAVPLKIAMPIATDLMERIDDRAEAQPNSNRRMICDAVIDEYNKAQTKFDVEALGCPCGECVLDLRVRFRVYH